MLMRSCHKISRIYVKANIKDILFQRNKTNQSKCQRASKTSQDYGASGSKL